MFVGLWGVSELQVGAERTSEARSSARGEGRRLVCGPGSYRLLDWLGRLGVAGMEPLALALNLSERAVYSHVRRLGRDGLVERVSGGDGDGGIAVLTRAGARVSEARGTRHVVSPRSAAPSSARHGRAVSWVAASAEVRGWRWLGPAELRAEAGWRVQREDGARHMPDLGFVVKGQRIAVEVELHVKAPRRVRAILRGYRALIDAGSLTAVTYVTDRPDVAALIEREARATLLGAALEVGPMDTVIEQARESGRASRAALRHGSEL